MGFFKCMDLVGQQIGRVWGEEYVRELLALELFARARLGPGPILAMQLECINIVASASLADGRQACS